MNNKIYLPIMFSLMLLLTSCSAIEGIFKAGMWWAFFLVFIVLAVIFWVISKFNKK
ncbi:hypothetical protein [Faecalibacter rhinopitheci]|uniref:hypothetical protein n=1 Tax=Faecalibacter rhinopitheci TaxID=2779678 RepID=UPI0018846979|nr:hypothetical protein [Faecalibacter rhinopitheci]